MLRNYVFVLWLSCFISANDGRNDQGDITPNTEIIQINDQGDITPSTEIIQINDQGDITPSTEIIQINDHGDVTLSTEIIQINDHGDLEPITEIFQISGNHKDVKPTTQRNQTNDHRDIKPSTQRNKIFSLKLFLHGTLEELKMVPRNDILHALWAMNQINVPLERKLIIWNTIKDNQSARTLSREILELCGKILIYIPEYDLYNLNITDWNIVDYLGTFDGFSRRKTGIIAYALKNYWGEDILEESKIINKFKGLICGFSPRNLNNLDSLTFSEISEDVFNHIYACTSRQLKVLLQNAMRMTTYGPPQAWNASDVERIGLVLRALDFEMLSKLRPESIEGISHKTISRMSPQYLLRLSNDQVKYLTDESLSAYRAVIRLSSSFASMLCKTNKILIISCVMKVIHFN